RCPEGHALSRRDDAGREADPDEGADRLRFLACLARRRAERWAPLENLYCDPMLHRVLVERLANRRERPYHYAIQQSAGPMMSYMGFFSAPCLCPPAHPKGQHNDEIDGERVSPHPPHRARCTHGPGDRARLVEPARGASAGGRRSSCGTA